MMLDTLNGVHHGHALDTQILPFNLPRGSKSDEQTLTIYYGAVVNPVSLRSYTVLPRAALAVNPSGTIAWLEEVNDIGAIPEVIKRWRMPDGLTRIAICSLASGDIIIPGFVDTHTHAPQMPNMGSGQQYELLDWLEHVTFPMEARFEDIDFAKRIYPDTVKRFIKMGTTTCCYYGTLHLEASKVLVDVIHELGQRALIGKCNMNRYSPRNYCEPSSETSLKDTEDFISYIRSKNSELIHPVLTPRFALSCTDDLLHALGNLARRDPTLSIQTHIAENRAEVAETLRHFPNAASYADVYAQHGLLTERTILAHGVYLADDELDMIKQRGAGISHCPTSNFNLTSGMARVGEMLDRGIKVGLGTDVSGGFSPSMLSAIQHASFCSKMVALYQYSPSFLSPSLLTSDIHNHEQFANKQLSIATLLYLATMGGAEVCCMVDKIGTFASGKSFDALIVNTLAAAGNPAVFGDLDYGNNHDCNEETTKRKKIEAHLEQFLFGGDDRNIMHVYVQGRRIGGAGRTEILQN